MKRLMLAAASAVAIGLSAQAAEWFNGGIADGWPNASTLSGGAWSNTDDTTYAGGELDVDAPDDAPLTFTATEAKGPATSVSVEVSMTVTFTPFAEVIAVPEGAKAGMIIAADKYYGIGKVEDAAAWVELGAASNVDQPKAIKVTRTADGLVYSVDGTAFAAVTPVSDESFQYVKMTGTGTLASLSAVEDPGAATVNGKPYATVAAAFAAAKDGDTVKIVNAGTAALGALTTAATTVDLNDQIVKFGNLTFTNATGRVMVKNGEFGHYAGAQINIEVKNGDLRLEGLTTWGIIGVKGPAGATFEAEGCQFLVGKTDANTMAEDGDGTTFNSQRLTLGSGFNFATAKLVGNVFQWANRPPISTSGSAANTVFFINGNEFNGVTNRNTAGNLDSRYPAMQAIGGAAYYIENNTYVGKMAQGAFGTYNSGSTVTRAKLYVINNTFGEGVKYLSVANGGSVNAATAVYFGDNEIVEEDASMTSGKYGSEYPNPWSAEPSIVLPTSVASFDAWLNGDDAAKIYEINGTLAEDLTDLAVGDTLIAFPGADVTVDPAKFSLTADETYVNKWTVAAPVSAVDLTVTIDAAITAVTYTKNGVDQGAVTSPIEGLKPSDELVFTLADADNTHFFAGSVVSGDLTAGETTANTFAFAVKPSLTTGTAEIKLTAESAFVKAVALDGGAETLIASPEAAWQYFTNGTHYVVLLKDLYVSGGNNQLSIQVGDSALIVRNGKSVRFLGAKWVCTVEDVDGAAYQKFTSYDSLAAAWTAKKSSVTYWLGGDPTSGGMGSHAMDASVITLDNDGLVFTGEFTPNNERHPGGYISKEPVTTASKTDAWGVAADGWTFRYEVEKTVAPGPQPTGDGAGSVEPVPGEPGVYVVKGDASSHNVSIDPKTLQPTDVIRVTDSTIGKITGVPADQIEIRLNGVTTAIDTKYFEGGDENGFSLELSDAAKATLVEESQEQKPLVIGDSVDVTINTVAGLKYQLIRGTEVGTIKTPVGEPKLGNGQALKLQDTNKPEGKAFYVIQTSK